MVATGKAVLAKENIQSVDVLSEKINEMLVPSGAPAHSDHVYAYGLEVLNLGLLYHDFDDAIRERDGDSYFILESTLAVTEDSQPLQLQQRSIAVPSSTADLTRKTGRRIEMVKIWEQQRQNSM